MIHSHSLSQPINLLVVLSFQPEIKSQIKVEKSACNTGNCCQVCNSGSTRDIVTAAETEEDVKKQIGIVFDKLLEQVRLPD